MEAVIAGAPPWRHIRSLVQTKMRRNTAMAPQPLGGAGGFMPASPPCHQWLLCGHDTEGVRRLVERGNVLELLFCPSMFLACYSWICLQPRPIW